MPPLRGLGVLGDSFLGFADSPQATSCRPPDWILPVAELEAESTCSLGLQRPAKDGVKPGREVGSCSCAGPYSAVRELNASLARRATVGSLGIYSQARLES
jgi:hypothetical protein